MQIVLVMVMVMVMVMAVKVGTAQGSNDKWTLIFH